ncbi:MAG: hypothetical protein IKO41_09795 [Lachnospiraceae bacterium]|nr:hypothetical protein [Lachnospiraceae bacterium]
MAERKNLANMKVKKKSADDKPWEKMYTGKKQEKPVNNAADKTVSKAADKAKTAERGKSGDRPKTAGVGKNAEKYKAAGAGKAGEKYKAAGAGKAVKNEKSAVKDEKAVVKKVVKEPRDFLYLLPKKTTAKSLAKTLDFLDRKAVEVWEDECILEITTKEGVITFEDIRESLDKEDLKILNDLRTKQVLSCDYESTNSELVQKVMATFLKEFGGKIGSDTENFEPFLPVEKL